MKERIKIPLSVPKNKHREYIKNFRTATKNSGNLMLFAGDQKVEHLNDDFVGIKLPPEVANPEHYFKIASKAKIGVFASQLGIISKYGMDYPDIPYIIKTNSKTNIIKEEQQDPFSNQWITVKNVLNFKKQSKLNIVGVGYTVYPGSEYESTMLKQAAQLTYEAHQNGLLSIIWMYIKGKATSKDDQNNNIHLIAGGAGIALALDADFVKVKFPKDLKKTKKLFQDFQEVTNAGGRTKVICSGGSKKGTKDFLETLYNQIHISRTKGNATARNIYQRKLDEAIRMANAISAISIYGYSVDDAYKIFKGEKELK